MQTLFGTYESLEKSPYAVEEQDAIEAEAFSLEMLDRYLLCGGLAKREIVPSTCLICLAPSKTILHFLWSCLCSRVILGKI